MRLMQAVRPGILRHRSGTRPIIASVSAIMPSSTYGAMESWADRRCAGLIDPLHRAVAPPGSVGGGA